jgi:DNA-binding transcriptional MerR regulator/quercetin dioxygenase-like cupin family protein
MSGAAKMAETVRFKIAEAARMAGVSPSTLRLWESQGLIEPVRTETGQRLYEQSHVDRLKKISWLRSEKGINPAAIRDNLAAEEPRQAKPRKAPRRSPAGNMGGKIRKLRRDAGETLERVSQETGISASLLSTFERTSQGLSLKSLHDLAHHFGTSFSALSGTAGTRHAESLVRRNRWTSWPPTTTGVSVQVLAEGRNMMDCHRFVLAPGATSEGAYAHEGEEFIHVLAGAMEIVLDDDRFFVLTEGDSFYFESRRPHSWRNMSEGETVLLWINTPATF